MPHLLLRGSFLFWLGLRPAVPAPVRTGCVAKGGLKKRMLARCVIGNEINDDANTSSVCLSHESLEVFVGSVRGIDVVIVSDVVAVIAHRLRNRHEPHAVCAEVATTLRISVVDVVESAGESLQITISVSVAVHKRADEDLVTNGIRPPLSCACPRASRVRRLCPGRSHS